METRRARVLCVDDCVDLTRAFGLLLGMQPDLESVGALDSADGLVAEAVRSRADVVLMDVHMPGKSPLEAVRELAERAPSCRVVVYSGDSDPRAREAGLNAGVHAWVSKLRDPSEVLRAIRGAVGKRV